MSSSISDRLGSLSKDHGGREVKRDKDEVKVAEDVKAEPAVEGGLIQRCVIIRRDEKGYGLTVSGESPVFVQSVKENGAAARAGVKQGDEIIKVNGSLVTYCNHIEVVKMIKSNSHVQLMLLGRPPGSNSPHQSSQRSSVVSPLSDRITAPQPVNAEKDLEFRSSKIFTIKKMHRQAVEDYEKTKQEYDRNPSEKLQNELTDKGKMVKAMESQLSGLISTESTEMPTSVSTSSHQGAALSPTHSLDAANDNQDTTSQTETSHTTSPSQKHNPAPWLVGGPKHRKHESMPASMYKTEDIEGVRGASVARSHSDSKKRKLTPSDSASFSHSEKIDEDGSKTPSLPSETWQSREYSPGGSPSPSPTPTHPQQMASPVSPSSHLAALSPASSLPSQQQQHGEMLTEEVPTASVDGATDTEQNTHEVNTSRTSQLSPSPTPDIFRQTATLQVQMPNQVDVISVEEDEFSTDDEHLDDHGAFADLNLLKQRPAHMAVFLYYLTSNSDPSPLLFHLVTDSYPQGNLKEMRKWAYEIHSTFLAEKAPLHVNVDAGAVDAVESVLAGRADREDVLRSVFQLARTQTLAESCELLADFRNKRSLGLGSLYGAHELQDENMDKQAELRIVEKYLMPHLETLLSDNASDRNAAMASALATFLRQVGVSQSRSNNLLERCPSFNVKDKKMFKFPKSNKKIHYTKGHHFIATHYYTVTYCMQCQGLLWGIGNQGFVCMNCECNIHKNCFEKVHELCAGRKKKGKSIMEKIITRKPSSNNPAAIMAAVKQYEDAPPKTSPIKSPHAGSAFYLDAALAAEQNRIDEIDSAAPVQKAPSRVGKLVERYQERGRSPDNEKSPMSGGLNTPRSHSPVPSETEDHRKSVTLNRSESLNRKKKKVPTATLR